MKIEICEITGLTFFGCTLLLVLCALGINGCNKTTETEQAAIKAGLEQKQNLGTTGTYWVKSK